jgi:hypothetical protein
MENNKTNSQDSDNRSNQNNKDANGTNQANPGITEKQNTTENAQVPEKEPGSELEETKGDNAKAHDNNSHKA